MAPLTQPHGFITTPALENQYRRAHIPSYIPGMHDPKEYDTLELLEDVFNKVIWRNSDDIHINSQQPPEMIQSDKTCDIVVRYKKSGEENERRILCFVKCKRTEKFTLYSLSELERQALDYCKEYLASQPTLGSVYACTACGAHLRLWGCYRGIDGLMPLWGSQEEGYWADYKDVGVDADAREIQQGFVYMTGVGPVF